jgi:hypothetical protein
MILAGARVAVNALETSRREIEIRGSRRRIDLEGYVVLPGMVNAHDHLEFNLFPRLGRGPYPNAGAWARDVYHPDEPPIRDQLSISESTRLVWGGLKNLLCGATTVCHHNPIEPAVFDRNFPVRVVKRFGWAHSLEFGPDLAARFGQTPPDWPFVLHLGEGTDAQARREIFQLDEMGALDHRTVLVHAVALDGDGLALAKRKRASIVWCPSSNLFLLGRTLGAEAFASGIPIALGSDSALTAEGDLLDELRVAADGGASPANLYQMVTEAPARMLRLPDRPDDLAIFRDTGATPAETILADAGPEMVIVNGRIKLVSPKLARRIGGAWPRFSWLEGERRDPVLVDADVPGLYRRAARVLGEVRLAHEAVAPEMKPWRAQEQ